MLIFQITNVLGRGFRDYLTLLKYMETPKYAFWGNYLFLWELAVVFREGRRVRPQPELGWGRHVKHAGVYPGSTEITVAKAIKHKRLYCNHDVILLLSMVVVFPLWDPDKFYLSSLPMLRPILALGTKYFILGAF